MRCLAQLRQESSQGGTLRVSTPAGSGQMCGSPHLRRWHKTQQCPHKRGQVNFLSSVHWIGPDGGLRHYIFEHNRGEPASRYLIHMVEFRVEVTYKVRKMVGSIGSFHFDFHCL